MGKTCFGQKFNWIIIMIVCLFGVSFIGLLIWYFAINRKEEYTTSTAYYSKCTSGDETTCKELIGSSCKLVAFCNKPNCPAGSCGFDGCGYICPACPIGKTCYNQKCCKPDCTGKCKNASDGCGGTCTASCPTGETCYNQKCCKPDCTGKCGPNSDNCGGSCNCDSGETCIDGTCQSLSDCAVGCATIYGATLSQPGKYKCSKASIKTGYTNASGNESVCRIMAQKACPNYTIANPGGRWQKNYINLAAKGQSPMDKKALETATWSNMITNYATPREDCCYYDKTDQKCNQTSQCCSINEQTSPTDTTYGNLTFS